MVACQRPEGAVTGTQGCLERAVTSTEGHSQPRPSPQVSLPGTEQEEDEQQMDCPCWVSMSISCRLHVGVTAFILSTVSNFFPFLISHLYYDMYLLIHLHFEDGVCFTASLVLPILT